MEPFPVLGDKVQDGNGINDGFVRRPGVYAGSSWTLQQHKTELCAMMNTTQ
jgi:hypothetical protein